MDKEDKCDFCGKPFNSEYHMSDECVDPYEELDDEGVDDDA